MGDSDFRPPGAPKPLNRFRYNPLATGPVAPTGSENHASYFCCHDGSTAQCGQT